MPEPHYTDHSAPTCWLCDRERGELCHVHDPTMRRFLPPVDTEAEPEAWSVSVDLDRQGRPRYALR